MKYDVIIIGAPASVDEKQPASDCHPVLLSIVAAERLSIVEGPLANWFKVDAVLTSSDIS